MVRRVITLRDSGGRFDGHPIDLRGNLCGFDSGLRGRVRMRKYGNERRKQNGKTAKHALEVRRQSDSQQKHGRFAPRRNLKAWRRVAFSLPIPVTLDP